jgi:hypothetical protein
MNHNLPPIAFNKCLSLFSSSLITFNEFKQAINSLLELSSTNELSKNETLANNYFKIKSARAKKKMAA